MAEEQQVLKDIVVKLKQSAKGQWLAEVRVQTTDIDNLQQLLTDAMDIADAEKTRRNAKEGY